MHAIIVEVGLEIETRFRQSLPPEHHVRASRPSPSLPFRVAELVVEGPMLPEVVDGEFQRGEMLMTMDQAPGVIRLVGNWRIGEVVSPQWQVGQWQTLDEMMEFMR